MGYGIDRGFGYKGSPQPSTVCDIAEEVIRAREKFPGNRFMLAALVEEVGELAKALLQRRPKEEIEREAIQVACLAIRIIEEGDRSFAKVTDAEAKL
jgi:NTP pyrophosphatase (non-canonical NTP hydrolase)